MDFGKLFTRAWQIIWNNKILWLFGFLASCTAGTGRGGANFNFSNSFSSSDFSGNLGNGSGEIPPFLRDFGRFMDRGFQGDQATLIAVAVGVFLFFLLLGILSFIIGNYGRVALIKGVQTAEKDEAKLEFSQLHQMGMAQLGQALLLNFLTGLVIALVFIAFFALAALGTVLTLGIGLICLIPLICVLVPVAWLVGMVLMQANIALVVEELGFMDALRRGIEVIRAKPGVIIGMYFVVLFGGGILALIIAIPFFLAMLPVFIGLIADPTFSQGFTTGLIVSIAGVCIYIPIAMFANSVLTSYIYSLFTLIFMDVTSEMASGKMEALPASGD